MATGVMFSFSESRLTSAVGAISGGTVYFYYTGTTNPAPIYTDLAITLPASNPVSVPVGGVLPNIFLDPNIVYRVKVVFTDGSTRDSDPINQDRYAAFIKKTPSGTLQDTATTVDALSTTVGSVTGSTGASYVPNTAPGTGGQTRSVATILSEAPINLHDYYAVADGANWAPAWTRAIAQMSASKRGIYVPPPLYGLTYYPMTANVVIDLAPFASTGFVIQGSGQQKSSFDFRGLGGSNFMIRCSGGVAPPGTPASCAYPVFRDIGMIGNGPGPVLSVGNPDLSDQINELRLHDVNVQNFNTTSTAVGAQFNSVYNADVLAVINCGSGGYVGGQGDAVQLIATAFSNFKGSYGSAQKSFHFTGSAAPQSGFNYGNVFDNCDMENVAYCVVQDHANTTRNTFVGGQWSYSVNGVHSPAGGRLLLVNPNANPSGGGTIGAFVGTPTGVLVQGRPFVTNNWPAIGASGAVMSNNSGFDLEVQLTGGSGVSINRNGGGSFTIPTPSFIFAWRTGETLAITYTTVPSMSLQPV